MPRVLPLFLLTFATFTTSGNLFAATLNYQFTASSGQNQFGSPTAIDTTQTFSVSVLSLSTVSISADFDRNLLPCLPVDPQVPSICYGTLAYYVDLRLNGGTGLDFAVLQTDFNYTTGASGSGPSVVSTFSACGDTWIFTGTACTVTLHPGTYTLIIGIQNTSNGGFGTATVGMGSNTAFASITGDVAAIDTPEPALWIPLSVALGFTAVFARPRADNQCDRCTVYR